MKDGSRADGTGTIARRGGGWRALLADVRGDGDPAFAALLAALTGSADAGRWGPATLEAAWIAAHRSAGHVAQLAPDDRQLGEVS